MANSDLIFVDASAWIALTEKSDKYYQQAAGIYAKIKEQRKRLVTSDYIISETATRIRYELDMLLQFDFLIWLCVLSNRIH